jgi:integrase
MLFGHIYLYKFTKRLNPVIPMLYKKPTTSGERALTPTEYAKLLEVCQTQEEILMLHLAIGLGLRRTDLSQIRISDIDLQNAKLSYYEHKKRRIRTVPLSPKLVQTIRISLAGFGKAHTKKHLFAWGSTQYGDRTAHRRLQTLCDRAGIPRRPFHALRATCIKFCQRAGWTPEQTAKLVGDTLRYIQMHYTVPSDEELALVVTEKEVI